MNQDNTSQNGKGLQTLLVWQRAMEHAVWVCQQVLPSLPPDERYALSAQLRRAAQSIPANIAEGYGRYYYQDAIRFCYIARGSCEEAMTQIILAFRLGYLNEGLFQQAIRDNQEVVRLINGYITFLRQSKRGENEPGSQRIREAESAYLMEEPQFDSTAENSLNPD